MSIRARPTSSAPTSIRRARRTASRSRSCTPRWRRARSRTRASPRTTWTATSARATRRAWAALSMADYMGLKRAAHRLHRDRRLLLPDPRRARRAGDRAGQVRRRADHARRPAARGGHGHRHAPRNYGATAPDVAFEAPYGIATVANSYAMAAMRHMHEFGTTSEQLAWIKVAASHHAQHNPHAMLREVVTVEDVVDSPMIADPLHRLDCCVVSDGGGAVIVARPEIAKRLEAPAGDGASAPARRRSTRWAARSTSPTPARRWSGPAAFAESGRDARPTSSTPRSTTASRSPC